MIGIVGAGKIVASSRHPAYPKQGIPVRTIYDIEVERAQSLAKRWSIGCAPDLESLLSDPAVKINGAKKRGKVRWEESKRECDRDLRTYTIPANCCQHRKEQGRPTRATTAAPENIANLGGNKNRAGLTGLNGVRNRRD